MQKKTYLLLLLIAGIACLSFCGCNGDPIVHTNCGDPIKWSNKNEAWFNVINLSVSSGQYYAVYTNRNVLELDVNNPIRDFGDVFLRPSQIQVSSKITVTTEVSADCENSANRIISQTFYNTTSWALNYSVSEDAIDRDNLISPYLGNSKFNFWRANKDYNYQTVKVDIVSGPYENALGNWCKIFWSKEYNANLMTGAEIKVDANNIVQVKAGDFSTIGIAVNITPKIPFTDQVYIAGSLVDSRITNVPITNDISNLQIAVLNN